VDISSHPDVFKAERYQKSGRVSNRNTALPTTFLSKDYGKALSTRTFI